MTEELRRETLHQDTTTRSAARHTRQLDEVVRQLQRHQDFVSAQQLHQHMVNAGSSIGLATVYRRLNTLVEDGSVDTIRLNGQRMFRICMDDEHHHHLVCERCGRTIEIEPPDEGWFTQLSAQYGYSIRSHTLDGFGLCPKCQRELKAA